LSSPPPPSNTVDIQSTRELMTDSVSSKITIKEGDRILVRGDEEYWPAVVQQIKDEEV